MKEINLLWNYLLNPTLEQESSNWISKFKRFLLVFGVVSVMATMAVGIQYGLVNFGLLDIQLLPDFGNVDRITRVVSIIWLIFFIPVAEELIFRLHLMPQKKNISISIILFIVYFSFNYIPLLKSTLGIVIFSILGALLLIGYLVFQRRINNLILNVWTHKFRTIFYITFLVFGGIHLFNHKLSTSVLIFAPFVVAPQVILGFNAGYLRVKSGFGWGLLLHIVYNFICIGLVPFLLNPSLFDSDKNEFTINYPPKSFAPKDYLLKIDEGKECVFNNYKVTPDEIFFENSKLKEIFISLAHAYNAKIIFESPDMENKTFNIKFKCKTQEKSNSRNNCHFIIEELFKKYKLNAQLYILSEGCWILTKNEDVNLELTNLTSLEHNEQTEESISVQDVSVNELVTIIDSLYSTHCFALLNRQQKFNFKIPKNDTLALRKILGEKYGLKFKKLKTSTDYFYISSHNDQ